MPDINKSYTWAIQTCNAPNVGYSIPQRAQGVSNGITHYDCSSFIWYALKAGGWDNLPRLDDWATGSMRGYMAGLGFTELSVSQTDWKAGDILLRIGDPYGHTEMVYQGAGGASGFLMGAHTSNADLADQVSIRESVQGVGTWQWLFRYQDGATGLHPYSPYVIAALCGNCWQESTMNPICQEVGGTGIGLFQWSGERRTRFLQWMSDNNYELSNGNAQLEYLLYEDVWTPKSAYPEFNTLSDFLNTTITDIDYLTEAFMRCWEIPNEDLANLPYRKQRAHECFNYNQQHANDSSISIWMVSNGYLGDEGGFNNSVMIYRYMSAGGGGGGTQSDTTKPAVFSSSNKGIVYAGMARQKVRIQWR